MNLNDQWMNLTRLETDNTKKLISTIIYMATLIVLGVIGNTLIILVYTVRIRTGTTRIFILALAVIDILNNIFGMSGEIILIVHSFTFTSTIMCKIIRLSNYITIVSSVYTLIAVAIDRHRKVCFPLSRQITEKGAKVMVGFAVFAAIAMAAPALLFHGVHEYKFHDVVVYECWYETALKGTLFPNIFLGLQFVVLVATIVILVVLYAMIGRKVFIHSKFSFKKMSVEKKRLKEVADASRIEEPINSGDQISEDSVVEMSEMPSDTNQPTIVANKHSIQINEQRKRGKARKIKSKTTLMLVALTTVFILSYLPHFIILVIKRIQADFLSSLSDNGYKVYNIFVRSYFVNSAANPIVYSFFNSRFRNEVARVISPCRQRE